MIQWPYDFYDFYFAQEKTTNKSIKYCEKI